MMGVYAAFVQERGSKGAVSCIATFLGGSCTAAFFKFPALQHFLTQELPELKTTIRGFGKSKQVVKKQWKVKVDSFFHRHRLSDAAAQQVRRATEGKRRPRLAAS